MAQLNIDLPEDLNAWLESRVASSHHASASDYVRDLISKDRDNARDDWPAPGVSDVREAYAAQPELDDDAKLVQLRAAINKGRASGVIERDASEVLREVMANQRRSNG